MTDWQNNIQQWYSRIAKSGHSVTSFAKLVGITRQALMRYISLETLPNVKVYYEINDKLDVLDELERALMGWEKLEVSECRTHHVFPDGTPAYPQRYDMVEDFSEGFAVAYKDDFQFHIKADGTRLYPKEYLAASDFEFGFAEVANKTGWHTINTKGERVND
jgi:hypothetical protein